MSAIGVWQLSLKCSAIAICDETNKIVSQAFIVKVRFSGTCALLSMKVMVKEKLIENCDNYPRYV